MSRDRYSFLDFVMLFTDPFVQWNLRRKAIRDMKIKPRDEILKKKFEWEQKMLVAEKTNQNDEYIKFKHYLDVLYWILNHENKRRTNSN